MPEISESNRQGPSLHDNGITAELNRNSLPQHVNQKERYVSLYGSMNPHHVTMITIGGAIHTGLMIGAGSIITDAGPAPIAISYTFVGLMVYLVLCALGEVASSSFLPSTIDRHAGQFCHPALGFAIGWIYFLKNVVVISSQLTASALLLSFWLEDEPGSTAVWITIFLVVIVMVNYCAARYLSTYEAALAFFKVLVVLGLIILSIVLAFRHGPEFRQGLLGWGDSDVFGRNHSGAGWLGKLGAVCETMPSATYAYLGTEMIGMTILQTPDPRRTTARAIRTASYRIVIYNLVSILLVAMMLPRLIHAGQHEPDYHTVSAFVVAIQMARIPVLPGILNGCILVFAVSSAACGLHMAIGVLYRMSVDGNAPVWLSTTNRRDIPVRSLCLCSILATLAYLNVSAEPKVLFGHFINMVTMFSILTWTSILLTHIAFDRAREAHGIPKRTLAFKAPLGQFGSWFAFGCCLFICLTRLADVLNHVENPGDTDYLALFTSYIGIAIYLALLLGYKLVTRCRRADPAAAGPFHRGMDGATEAEPVKKEAPKRIGRTEQVKQFVRLWTV